MTCHAKHEHRPECRKPIDILIQMEGSIWLLTGQSKKGHAWLDTNVHKENWNRWGKSIAADWRMGDAIAQGAQDDGLDVAFER